MAVALNLAEARRFLDPRPLDFRHKSRGGAIQPTDPSFYHALPPRSSFDGRLKIPGAVENLRDGLLRGSRTKKMFLSGHVGSGKSTELSRLAIEPEIMERFTLVFLRFEEQEWASLDSAQVLFRLAAAIFEFAEKERLLSRAAKWSRILGDLNERIFGPTGLQAREGTVGLEFNLLVVKLKQELKLSEKARQQFRKIGETEPTLLQDLIGALVDDIETNLAKSQRPAELLLLVDDLDKVRSPEQQKEIFATNLNALLVPPLRVVYTIPTGVYFGESRAEVRQNLEHLYPVRVLKKSREFDPEGACLDERLPFFQELVAKRVAEGLIHDDAIRLAAIYSGGVMRDFLRLLRDGIQIATYNELDVVDEIPMRYAVKEATLKESAGLYADDYVALSHVHRTNELKSVEDRRLLDLSRVLECYNDAVWFEVNPLLWKLLQHHNGADQAGL